MSFKSKKNKLKYLQKNQSNNTVEIEKQILINQLIIDDFDKKNKKNTYLQIIQEAETDWFPMDFPYEVPEYTVYQTYGWEIFVGEFPESYIPFIRTTMLYRNVVNTGDIRFYNGLTYSIIKGIEDLPNGNKKLTLYGSFYVMDSFPGELNINNRFEGKLKIQILNPLS